jgi:hypothetical protein
LRHSDASALHDAGRSPRPRAGSGTGAGLHLETYAHVIDPIRGERYTDQNALLGAARTGLEFPDSSLAPGFRG